MNNKISTFVTVIAWLFIVGSGLAILFLVLQNIMFFVFMNEEFAQQAGYMPNKETFLLVNLPFLLLFLALFISSIGLLKRKSWARLAFIVLLALGIVLTIREAILEAMLYSSEMSQDNELPDYVAIILWFVVLIRIGIAVLFAWIIKRLLPDSVKQEFMG